MLRSGRAREENWGGEPNVGVQTSEKPIKRRDRWAVLLGSTIVRGEDFASKASKSGRQFRTTFAVSDVGAALLILLAQAFVTLDNESNHIARSHQSFMYSVGCLYDTA